jgi:SAM-dependent methyltransferase
MFSLMQLCNFFDERNCYTKYYKMIMKDVFLNAWDNETAASSYGALEFPNTYYLAYRDLPEIIYRHVRGNRAVDFGCGTGRSTRFVRRLGFDTVGIDISTHMIKNALTIDTDGIYMLVSDKNYSHLGKGQFNLVTAIFTFDNIPGWENRTGILASLSELLCISGKIIMLCSRPELYTHEWASFTTRPFPLNKKAKTGDVVHDIILDVEDKTPCDDIFWTGEDYEKLFLAAGLETEASYKPLGYDHEPYRWVNEKEIAPWIIYVLKKQ